MSSQESYGFIKDKIYESIKELEFLELSLRTESGELITKEQFSEIYDDIVLSNYEIEATDIEFYTPEDAKHLSKRQKDFIDEIEVVMKDDDLSLQSVLYRISDIQERAIATLSEEELFVILTATSVVANTCSYWHSYFNDNSLRAPFSWKKVGVSDVSGAVGGAVAAGARWLFCGPPGWKLTAALVIGGAAGSSVANAVSQLLS